MNKIINFFKQQPLYAFSIIILLEIVNLWNGMGFVGGTLYGDDLKGLIEMTVMAGVAVFLPINAKGKNQLVVALYVIMDIWAMLLLANASYFVMREGINPGQINWIATATIWNIHVDVIMSALYTYVLPAMTLVLIIGQIYGAKKEAPKNDKEKLMAIFEAAQIRAKADGKPLSINRVQEEIEKIFKEEASADKQNN